MASEPISSLLAEVRAVYQELAKRPVQRNCIARTECCQFQLTGLTPHLTKGEALLAAKAFRSTGRRELPVTASRIEKGGPAVVDCVEPTPVVSLVGFPARFEREKLTAVAASLLEAAGFSLPDPPEGSLPETATVAVNDPAVLFAVKSGELEIGRAHV